MKQEGLRSQSIDGYGHEEYTHLAVAAVVFSGRADCALGIAGAASALGLDFIPLYEERYDLVVPQLHFESYLFAPALELARDKSIQQEISAVPGFKIDSIGVVLESIG